MTEHELSQYRFLIKEKERLYKVMEETVNQEYIAYKCPVMDSLPRGNQTGDSTFYATVNAHKKKETREDREQFAAMLASIEQRIDDIQAFIYGIPDGKTRLIFQYKFMDDMTLSDIGNELNYSISNIKKIISNYIKSAKSA